MRCGQLRDAQQRDPAIRRAVDLKLEGPRRMSRSEMAREPKIVQQLVEVWDKLEVKSGILLYRVRTGGAESRYVPVLPKRIRADIFERLHHSMDTLTHGQVLKLVRQKFYWPSIHNEAMGYMRLYLKRRRQQDQAMPPPKPDSTNFR